MSKAAEEVPLTEEEFRKYEEMPIDKVPVPGLLPGIELYKHQQQTLMQCRIIEAKGPIREETIHYPEDKSVIFADNIQGVQFNVGLQASANSYVDQTPKVGIKGYMECYSRIGILANKPGSGKTAVILSLCLYQCRPPKLNTNGFSSRMCYYSYTPERRYINTNFIITDKSILSDAWMKDIHKFFGTSISWWLIDSSNAINGLSDEALIEKISSYKVIFINRTMFQHIFRIFTKIVVARIIFDEIQSLAITNEKKFQNYINHPFLNDAKVGSYRELMPANFIWIVCATPDDIKSGTSRYMTNYLLKNAFFFNSENYPELSKNYIIRFPDEYIDKFTNIPKPSIYELTCKRPIALELVEGLVDNNILEMIQNDQLGEAINQLEDGGVNIYTAALASLHNKLNIAQSELHTMTLNRKTHQETIDDKRT